MTKRLNDLQLPVTSDLSECSFDAADEMIVNEVIKQDLSTSISFFVLTVASQNLGLASVMRMRRNFTIDIDGNYSPSEWSLTRKDMVNKEIRSITVWSEGC